MLQSVVVSIDLNLTSVISQYLYLYDITGYRKQLVFTIGKMTMQW